MFMENKLYNRFKEFRRSIRENSPYYHLVVENRRKFAITHADFLSKKRAMAQISNQENIAQ
jgi:heat shock protein HspQ